MLRPPHVFAGQTKRMIPSNSVNKYIAYFVSDYSHTFILKASAHRK